MGIPDALKKIFKIAVSRKKGGQVTFWGQKEQSQGVE